MGSEEKKEMLEPKREQLFGTPEKKHIAHFPPFCFGFVLDEVCKRKGIQSPLG